MWIRGSGKALWGIDPDSLEDKMPANLPNAPLVREDYADYLGEAQAFDAYVGVIVKQLADAGRTRQYDFGHQRRPWRGGIPERQMQLVRLRHQCRAHHRGPRWQGQSRRR